MARALELARRGLHTTHPNPRVGCVIVKNGEVVGEGFHERAGGPHAEIVALQQAGARAKGAEVFVTLEPCCHHGRTAPCTDALAAAGVARVVAAMEDPNPLVAGKGLAALRAAGIEAEAGTLEEEAAALNRGFVSRMTRKRPFVTLKLAMSLDGRTAMGSGESRWITGERARAHVHALRAQHDAVMIGVGSALADDPELTCRLPGVDAQPVRIVVDSNARLPTSSKLVSAARAHPVWVLASPSAPANSLQALQAGGVKIIAVAPSAAGVDLSAALKALAKEGLTRILVEGGAALAASLLKANLVDRLLWYRAPSLMGEGVAAVTALGMSALNEMPRFQREWTQHLGDDTLESYRAAS